MESVTIHHGDMLEVLPRLAAASLDACVTDPPYGLAFMGQGWDRAVPGPAYWRAVYRVLKPGAHLLAFSGSRTVHRLGCAIEDAGFEIRDTVWDLVASDPAVAAFVDSLSAVQAEALGRLIEGQGFGGLLGWIFGSGFPKSHDVSKAIDKAAGVERRRLPRPKAGKVATVNCYAQDAWTKANGISRVDDAPITDAAASWQGWGTALKPALEPILLARKPLDGTIIDTVRRHGTGALNIDGCRIATVAPRPARSHAESRSGLTGRGGAVTYGEYGVRGSVADGETTQGRWPANVVHDGSGEVLAVFPAEAGASAPVTGSEPSAPHGQHVYGDRRRVGTLHHGDSGSAARFFYASKAGPRDRVVACAACGARAFGPPACGCMVDGRPADTRSHPTVKPVALVRWLVRLVTPPGGVVLDPFAGTGTTGVAAAAEGLRAVLVEREADYVGDARFRLDHIAGLDGALLAPARPGDADRAGEQLGLEGMA